MANGTQSRTAHNPAVSGEQYRLAQAVLSGEVREGSMDVKTAREIVDGTPHALRVKWSHAHRSNPGAALVNLWGKHRITGTWTKLQGPSDEVTLEQYLPYFKKDTLAASYANVPHSGFSGDTRPTYTEFKFSLKAPKQAARKSNFFGLGKKKTTFSSHMLGQAFALGKKGGNLDAWIAKRKKLEPLDASFIHQLQAEYRRGVDQKEREQHGGEVEKAHVPSSDEEFEEWAGPMYGKLTPEQKAEARKAFKAQAKNPQGVEFTFGYQKGQRDKGLGLEKKSTIDLKEEFDGMFRKSADFKEYVKGYNAGWKGKGKSVRATNPKYFIQEMIDTSNQKWSRPSNDAEFDSLPKAKKYARDIANDPHEPRAARVVEKAKGSETGVVATYKRKQSANPSSSAASLYSMFHGRESTQVTEVEERIHYHSNLAELGVLSGLKVRTPTGFDLTLEFEVPEMGQEENGKPKGSSGPYSLWVESSNAKGEDRYWEFWGNGTKEALEKERTRRKWSIDHTKILRRGERPKVVNGKGKGPLTAAYDFGTSIVPGMLKTVDRTLLGAANSKRKRNPTNATVILCSNESGNQLYLRAGDQSIPSATITKVRMSDQCRDLMNFGEIWAIAYITRKSFDDFKRIELNYINALGRLAPTSTTTECPNVPTSGTTPARPSLKSSAPGNSPH